MGKQSPPPELETLFRSEFRRLVDALEPVAGSREAAADAVQDAFIQAFRHWTRISTFDSPRAWLRRTAVNRLLNQRRSTARRDRTAARVSVVAADDPDYSLRLTVVHALAKLTERDRTIVCLYYIGDFSIGDVADTCGESEAAVKTVLFKARHELSRTLGGVP